MFACRSSPPRGTSACTACLLMTSSGWVPDQDQGRRFRRDPGHGGRAPCPLEYDPWHPALPSSKHAPQTHKLFAGAAAAAAALPLFPRPAATQEHRGIPVPHQAQDTASLPDAGAQQAQHRCGARSSKQVGRCRASAPPCTMPAPRGCVLPARPFFPADNYTEPIHGGLELESNPPYLMYTHGNDEVCWPRHSAAAMITLAGALLFTAGRAPMAPLAASLPAAWLLLCQPHPYLCVFWPSHMHARLC